MSGKYIKMNHHEDEPSSSCIIKQELEGEGIYASTACFESRDPKTDQGLTLPPKIQSSDPWPSNAAWSPADDEIDALLDSGQDDQLESEPRRDDLWALTLFEDEYQLPDPSRKKRRRTDLPAPDSNQGAKSASRTPSPAQSNCLASISQTPARSETPQTPSDPEHEVPLPDSYNYGDQGQSLSDGEAEDGYLSAKEKFAPEPPVEREITKEPQQVFPSPLGSGPDDKASRAKHTQRMTTWDADTPIPSIETNLHQNRTTTILAKKPSLSASQLSEDAKAKSRVQRGAMSSSTGVGVGIRERCSQAGLGKTSECEQPYKRARTTHTTTSSTNHLDRTTSQLFSTFMKLRNSLPISVIMAMLLPPQRKDILQAVAELFHTQNWISRSGVTQSVPHELPEALRALLNQLKGKFQTDEQFRKSVILFIVEELKDTCEAKGAKRVNMDDILQIGIDQLKTCEESKEQLLYERKHYHGLLVDMDGEIAVQKERIQRLEAELRAIRANNPQLSSTAANTSTSSIPGTPQLELENGVPKHNPFWVCCLMLLDGSGVQCHGMNREWHQLHKPGRAGKWTQRRQCFRCGRTNKSNRKYISDIEAKMLGGVTKSGRINPYGNQPQTSQQGSSRQTSSHPAQHPVIISPTSPVKSSPSVYIGYPPVNIPQPGQHSLILSPKSPVKQLAATYTSYPSVDIPQPSVLQPTPYDDLPVIFTGPIPPANISKTKVRTATMGALTFPAVAQEALTTSLQPVLPADIPRTNVRTATMGALALPASAPEYIASPIMINSPSSDISDPEQVDFSQWMGVTTMHGNNTNSHLQVPQQLYGNGMNNYLRASQEIYGDGTNDHLQATHQLYGNGINNQNIIDKKRPATTPPNSDPPSPKKVKLHPGFNFTKSTQETLRLQLQKVQKPWMSLDFTQKEKYDESSQSDNDSLFGDGEDVAYTSEIMSPLFGDNGRDDTQALDGIITDVDDQGDISKDSGAATESNKGVKTSNYEIDCELFGEKYANERREKEAGQLKDADVDLDAQLEADLLAALDAELAY